MKTVILLTGPRGAGKTTYAESVIKQSPEIQIVSRDQTFVEYEGTTTPSIISPIWSDVVDIVFEKMRKIFSESKTNIVILDFWNRSPARRKSIISLSKQSGADRVVCWQFITPREVCSEWFRKKPGSPSDSDLFFVYWLNGKTIHDDGFDAVYSIDPRQPFSGPLQV